MSRRQGRKGEGLEGGGEGRNRCSERNPNKDSQRAFWKGKLKLKKRELLRFAGRKKEQTAVDKVDGTSNI